MDEIERGTLPPVPDEDYPAFNNHNIFTIIDGTEIYIDGNSSALFALGIQDDAGSTVIYTKLIPEIETESIYHFSEISAKSTSRNKGLGELLLRGILSKGIVLHIKATDTVTNQMRGLLLKLHRNHGVKLISDKTSMLLTPSEIAEALLPSTDNNYGLFIKL